MKRFSLILGILLASVALVLLVIYAKGIFFPTEQDFAKDTGLAEDFAVSPDDRRIAFSSYKNGVAALYTANIDGSHPTPLTQDRAAHHLHPRFSPDGSRILFLAVPLERDKQPTTLYIQNADGTDQHPLTNGKTIITEAAFAPDGKTIYYIQSQRYEEVASYRPVDHDLFSMSVDGSNKKQVTHLALNTMENMTIAADGSKILYESTDPKTFHSRFELLPLPNAQNPQPVFLTGFRNFEQPHDPSLLPDSQQFLFTDTNLFLGSLQGTTAQQVTRTNTAAVNPVPLHHSPSALFMLNPTPTKRQPEFRLMRIGLDGLDMKEVPLQLP